MLNMVHLKSCLGLSFLLVLLLIAISTCKAEDQPKQAQASTPTPAPEAEVSDEDDDDDKSSEQAQAAKPTFKPPTVPEDAYLAQFFSAPSNLAEHMVISKSKKEGVATDISKYDGFWSVEVPETSAIIGDYGLVLKSKAKHHAVSTRLTRPFAFDNSGKQFVMQYEVKFQNGMDCGGAYVKLLTEVAGLDLLNFNDKTGYTIMFGPDKCGTENKLHFILRHKNPKSGEIEEKHAKKPKAELDSYFTDKRTHLYTLVLNSDNSFEIYVDRSLVNSGSLLEDMDPPINPPKEIDDPNDKKPSDWDEREKIPDPKATKPEDWDETQPEMIEDADATMPTGWLTDEPKTIADPKAEKPKDWDEDMDGQWEAPQIDNPKCKEAPGCGQWIRPKIKNPNYKGKWSPPMIDNPAYKGIWKPKRIANPHYFEDKQPWQFQPIGAIGFELWSMTDSIVFDNLLIVDRKSKADDFAEQTWVIKRDAEKRADPSSQSVVDAVKDLTRDRPWIWAAVLLLVVLPTVLIIAYCCFRPSDDSSSPAAAAAAAADDAARRKKTDQPSGDDHAATSKESLEGDEEDEDDEEDDDEDEADKEGVDLDAADGDKPANERSGTRSSARKRATRKE